MATPTFVQIQKIHMIIDPIHIHLGWRTSRVTSDMKKSTHACSDHIITPSPRIRTTLPETFARQLLVARKWSFTCYGAIDETRV